MLTTIRVLNLAHVYFACEVLPISVKTEDAAHHKYTGHDIYTHTAALFSSAFYDVDPDSSFALQRAAKVISTGFAQEIEPNVRSIASSAFVRNASSLSFERILEKHKFDKIHQLLRKGQTIEEIVWSYVIPMIMAIIPQGGQFVSHIIYSLFNRSCTHQYYLGR